MCAHYTTRKKRSQRQPQHTKQEVVSILNYLRDPLGGRVEEDILGEIEQERETNWEEVRESGQRFNNNHRQGKKVAQQMMMSGLLLTSARRWATKCRWPFATTQ
mmetsp:Transcript_5764/g.5125  ORF Transcript_5764/g.5125 Transcript_5764/m.5125 type:complete len:104 (+) Transcript_5764:309-620(+)